MTNQPRDSTKRSHADRTDQITLSNLYQQVGPALFAYLLRFVQGDRQRAEDILQETIIRAWRRPESRRPDGTWNVPWLFTVGKNIAIDQLRAISSRPAEVADAHINERSLSEDTLASLLDGAEVRAAVASLPQRHREVLVELYLRDRTIAEAAQTLGVPQGTVKSRAYYALGALHRALNKREFFPR